MGTVLCLNIHHDFKVRACTVRQTVASSAHPLGSRLQLHTDLPPDVYATWKLYCQDLDYPSSHNSCKS